MLGCRSWSVKKMLALRHINEVIDSLEEIMHFSIIDLLSGYFKMTLEEESQSLGAFKTPQGPYK